LRSARAIEADDGSVAVLLDPDVEAGRHVPAKAQRAIAALDVEVVEEAREVQIEPAAGDAEVVLLEQQVPICDVGAQRCAVGDRLGIKRVLRLDADAVLPLHVDIRL
jgi:hypothetical protein